VRVEKPCEAEVRIKTNNPLCYKCRHLRAVDMDGTIICRIWGNTRTKAWCMYYAPVEQGEGK
jgi:hypothetical protein